MDFTKTITHLGLCAGYGGIELGLKRVIPTLRSIALCEIEAFAVANLVSKMEAGLMDPAPIWTDLKTFPWAAFRDRVDILTGGYPCQPFSAAGKRLGGEDPRHLWPHISRGVSILQPRVCFFENVEGHITCGLHHVLCDLGRLGYRTTWGLFSASECGAPHQRKRVFILAHRKCEGLEGWISGVQSESNGCRSSSDLGESSNVLVNSINNDGSNVCRVQHGKTKQSITSISSGNVADSNNSRSGQDQLLSELRTTRIEQSSRCSRLPSQSTKTREVTAWPSRPGEQQYGWEPPRVVADSHRIDRQAGSAGEDLGNTEGLRVERWQYDNSGGNRQGGGTQQSCGSSGSATEFGQTQLPLGRNFNEPTSGLDYAELCVTCDNRTDELRLLGNGVVPATAALAFRTLMNELCSPQF